MKITIDRNGDGVHVEIERDPLPAGRFRAICALVGAGVYVGMVTAVTALCGPFGLLLAMGGTVLTVMMVEGLR